MKILRINKFYYQKGGAERHYFALSKMLARHGHKIIPFSMQDKRNEPTEYANYFIKNIDYKKFSAKNIFKFFYNREAVKKLEELINQEKPDLAHLHNIYHQLTPAIINVLKKHNIPIVMTVHDLKIICPHYNILLIDNKMCCDCGGKKFYRHLLGKCSRRSMADFAKAILLTLESYYNAGRYKNIDVLIAPSLFFKRLLEKAGFNDKVIYLPHFYNEEDDNKQEAKKQSGDLEKNYIMYAGRLSKEKGVRGLILAMAELQKRKGDKTTQLLIAGDGPEKNRLIKLTKKLGLNNYVLFLGHLDTKNLYTRIKKAKAIVVPSECYENAPNAVIEAMLLTKIVICAKIGGLADMAEDNVSGFFFKPGNIKDLADVIEKVINMDENQLKKIAAEGNEFIKKQRNPEDYYKNILEIYKSVI